MSHSSATIDWQVPATGLDAFFGDGARPVEKVLPTLTGLAGVGLLAWYAAVNENLNWAWWRYLVAAVLAFDLVGGVVANGLNSAKRFQHAEQIAAPRRSATLVRNHQLFAAIHVQPVIVAALFPGARVWWGVLWYVIALVAVALVVRVPLYLQRPVALLFVALAPMLAMVPSAPRGFAWLPAVLIAKLVLGAVREEPYRPNEEPHRSAPTSLA